MNEGHYLKRAIEYFNHSWRVFAIFLAISLFGAGLNSTSNPNFIATAHMVIKQGDSSPLQAISASVAGMQMGRADSELQRYMLFLASMELYRGLALKIYNRPDYYMLYSDILSGQSSFFGHSVWAHIKFLPFFSKKSSTSEPTNEQIDRLSTNLKGVVTFRGLDSTTIQVRVRTGSKKSSVDIANMFVDLAIQEIHRQDVEELQYAKKFLEGQVVEVSRRIKTIENELVKEKRKVGSVSLNGVDGVDTEVSKENINIQRDLVSANLRIDNNRRMIASLQNEIAAQGSAADDEHSDFAQNSKFSLKNQIQRLHNENKQLMNRIATLKPLAEKYAKVQGMLPQAEQTLMSLRRRIELEYNYFSDLKSQILKMDMQAMSLQNRISRLDRPEDVLITEFMTPAVQAGTGVVIGLLFALLVCFLYETLNPHVFSRKDVEDLDVRYMGSINEHHLPYVARFKKFLKHPLGQKAKSEVVPLVVDKVIEDDISFRYLRSSLFHTLKKSSGRAPVVAVVSPVSEEGKTYIAYNLAHIVARAKKKTLIIDCDFHIGSLTAACRAKNNMGITDFLMGKTGKIEDVITSLGEHLDVVAAGQSCAEAIENLPYDQFDRALDRLKQKYDYVILDTPAVIPAVDALDMVRHVDMVLLTVLYGHTRIDLAKRTVEKLKHITRAPLGFIMNKHDFDSDGNYGYYYSRSSHLKIAG